MTKKEFNQMLKDEKLRLRLRMKAIRTIFKNHAVLDNKIIASRLFSFWNDYKRIFIMRSEKEPIFNVINYLDSEINLFVIKTIEIDNLDEYAYHGNTEEEFLESVQEKHFKEIDLVKFEIIELEVVYRDDYEHTSFTEATKALVYVYMEER